MAPRRNVAANPPRPRALLLLPLRRIVQHPRGMLFFYLWNRAEATLLASAAPAVGAGAIAVQLVDEYLAEQRAGDLTARPLRVRFDSRATR